MGLFSKNIKPKVDTSSWTSITRTTPDPDPVKKAPIIGAYQVMLYCIMCDMQMPVGVPKYDIVTDPETKKTDIKNYRYQYICPKCGYTHYSTTQYPYQQLQFDKSKMITAPDWGECYEDGRSISEGANENGSE